MTDDLDMIAAAEHLLANSWAVFSKKQNADTGSWWIEIYCPTLFGAMANATSMDEKVRGHGGSLAEAIEVAMTLAGIGGLQWKVKRLDTRMRALREFLGFKDTPLPKKECPHGVSGGRCKRCV